jgi:hypothetical protein
MCVRSLAGLFGLLAVVLSAASPAAEQGQAPAERPPTAAAGAKARSATEVPRVVMARVGSHEITVQEFMRYLSKEPSLLPQTTTDAGKARVLRDMIRQVLLGEAMKREGLIPEGNGKKITGADYMRGYQSLMAKHFPMPPAPSEAEAYKYYEQHRERYGIPETVRVSQIQFRLPDHATDAERSAVRARAEAALKRLRGGAPFAQVAAELTQNPEGKLTKGDLGFLPLHQNPWLEKALKGLKVGDFTGVIESPVAFEILQLTDRRESLIAPFPNVRARVIAEMRQAGQTEARNQYLKAVAKEVGVTIEMPELKDAMP